MTLPSPSLAGKMEGVKHASGKAEPAKQEAVRRWGLTQPSGAHFPTPNPTAPRQHSGTLLTRLCQCPDVPVLNDVQSQGRREGAELVGQQSQEAPPEIWGYKVLAFWKVPPANLLPPSMPVYLSKRP